MKARENSALSLQNCYTMLPIINKNSMPVQDFIPPGLLASDLDNEVPVMLFNRLKKVSAKNKKLEEENRLLNKKIEHLSSQLVKQDAAASYGLLVQGMVHNLNNPLAVINGRLDLLNLSMQKDHKQGVFNLDKYKENVALIKKNLENLTSMIRNTLARSVNHKSEEKTEIDINSLFEQELKFLEANTFFKHNINLKLETNPDLPKIQAVYSDLSQIFMNIIQNSIDAMWQSREKTLTVKTDSNDQQITVEISDTGCGIAEENLPKIFDVFYTTKPKCSTEIGNSSPTGTGLGMYMVAKLAEEYNMKYEIKSQVNVGTSFKILIPVKKIFT